MLGLGLGLGLSGARRAAWWPQGADFAADFEFELAFRFVDGQFAIFWIDPHINRHCILLQEWISTPGFV